MNPITQFCLVLLVIAHTVHTTPLRRSVIPGSATTTAEHVSEPCPVYYYHDHGTGCCEFCCDICCQAKTKGTTKQCNSECPKYAKKLEEDAQKVLDDKQKLADPGTGQSTGQTPAWSLPLAVQITIPLAAFFLLLIIPGLVYAKRHTLAGLLSRREATDIEDPDPALELLPVESVPPDTDSRELDISMERQSELVPRTSIARLSTEVGLLEFSAAVQTASYRPGRGEPAVRSAITESMEGRNGPDLRVFPTSRLTRDDTEVKTFHGSQSSQQTTV